MNHFWMYEEWFHAPQSLVLSNVKWSNFIFRILKRENIIQNSHRYARKQDMVELISTEEYLNYINNQHDEILKHGFQLINKTV